MGAGQTRLRGALCTFDHVPDPGNAGVGRDFMTRPSGTNMGEIFYEKELF